jgi:hypothetical protein
MKHDPLSLKMTLVLALLGGAIHLLSLQWSLFQHLSADRSTSFVNNMFVISTYVLLGGILYGALLRQPVSEAIRQRKTSVSTLVEGGLFGMFATAAALQGRYLAMGSVLTYQARIALTPVREQSIRGTFLICMIPVETYGLLEIICFAVPAFVGGMLIVGLAGTASQLSHS